MGRAGPAGGGAAAAAPPIRPPDCCPTLRRLTRSSVATTLRVPRSLRPSPSLALAAGRSNVTVVPVAQYPGCQKPVLPIGLKCWGIQHTRGIYAAKACDKFMKREDLDRYDAIPYGPGKIKFAMPCSRCLRPSSFHSSRGTLEKAFSGAGQTAFQIEVFWAAVQRYVAAKRSELAKRKG